MDVELQVAAPGDALCKCPPRNARKGHYLCREHRTALTVSCSYCAAIWAALPIYLYVDFQHCC